MIYLHRVKYKTFALVCGLIFVGLASVPASAACLPSKGSGFASGSAISRNQVVICATQSQQNTSSTTSRPSSPTKTTTSKPAKTAPSISCAVEARTTQQIVAATLAGCSIVGPSAPPPAQVVVKPGKPATTQLIQVNSSQSAEATLSPRVLSIAASQSVLRVGEAVVLTSDAGEHEKTAVILGRLGFVRFTPIDFEWFLEPAQSSPVAVASFAAEGTKRVALSVAYLASARFSLVEPWVRVGSVTATAELELRVDKNEAIKPPRLSARLVSASCEVKPSSYRCE
ncbi:MAG: hypothetical protein RLZZ345_125 [Actinomycetota bacterium]